MQNLLQQTSKWKYLWCRQNITYWAVAWAALSIVIYSFIGGAPTNIERPIWYRFFTGYILQIVPFIVGGLLCFRNGLSRRMPSGSKVWFLIGIALISFIVGNLFFASWELVWHLNSTGSLGDPFFCIFYICLSLAMGLAIYKKRARFKPAHWLVAGGMAIYAAMGVVWMMQTPPAIAVATAPTPPALTSQVQSLLISTDAIAPSANTAPNLPGSAIELQPTVPGWVMFFDDMLKPYGKTLNIFYVCCDVVLFTMASGMILAFWGRRFSNTWQVNAQAVVCFYIADMWYAYAGNQIKDYQGGFALEVFWILGGIQFAIAAAIEFEYMLLQEWILGLTLEERDKRESPDLW